MVLRATTTAFALGLGLFSATLSGTAAADIDGKKNLVCAGTSVIGCIDGATCLQGTLQDFDLPAFMFINVKTKVVSGTDEQGNQETSPIKNLEKTEKQFILQGIEKHRGWTIAINRADGSMSLSSSGQDVSFVMTGNCTAL